MCWGGSDIITNNGVVCSHGPSLVRDIIHVLCFVQKEIYMNQELMSGEAAKERATTTYARVPSKSKLLASELPNMETCSSI